MNKAVFKSKTLRFWQLQYELVHEHELTYQQGAVYAYLHNHCININNNGYCGYSDEKMAEDLKLTYRTFKRELGILKQKVLIIIQNPQKRSKKAGQSRMIYINPNNYLMHQQLDITAVKNNNLRLENEKLKRQITELEKKIAQINTDSPKTSYLGILLVKVGFMPEDVYIANIGLVNSYLNYLTEHTDPFWAKKAIDYFAKNSKKTKINCYISYLEKCVFDSILTYDLQKKNQKLSLQFGEFGLQPQDD